LLARLSFEFYPTAKSCQCQHVQEHKRWVDEWASDLNLHVNEYGSFAKKVKQVLINKYTAKNQAIF
jgi:hypothetical protein